MICTLFYVTKYKYDNCPMIGLLFVKWTVFYVYVICFDVRKQYNLVADKNEGWVLEIQLLSSGYAKARFYDVI